MAEDIAVTKFRDYLRVNTEQPTPDYAGCQKFLFGLADELGIKRRAVEAVSGKPFIIMTIPGSEQHLSSLVLYSHTDVVPTFKDKWKYDPYSGHKDEQGNIYGRGTQDMKSVGSQYLEAIRRHFNRGKKQWLRTIHIVWAPEEEVGALDGMEKFVKMPEFRELNLGFMLDEGLATEGSKYKVYYAERNPWCKSTL
ncbi:N-acyl-L-amino-acid amidohydrolase [Necator americanus]|uniref:N-acyl-L-amino-acid amidohydrolase n=1 Tax=Necator americanus TaxID=51031 RepID=W2TJJ5_NECAM|nr:N-acyl-L-amino-acid amidohydrolase [Necator americanus]ETN81769.1 N-acyl-L-amino-acid amidohydrolase [Necator americanus]